MQLKIKRMNILLSIFAVTIFTFMLLFMSQTPTASADLPPREHTPTPESSLAPIDGSQHKKFGAYIVLSTTTKFEGYWSEIQWQDEFGIWNDVDGWKGHIEPDGTKTWWVKNKDFDTGPFRWLIYDEEDGYINKKSEPFTLPMIDKEVLIIVVE
ncbi:MAG: hypothetical protein DWQ04_04850 [Chloroflexi bacterium]|nr:MAG: hypothetical protein DWQ04_04850 [Chloroflexota bacterium]